ncbi:MAG: hypothetical protein RLY86_3728 [Pseudomonadota bacterium]|jgi:hypothetical protein
MLDFFSQDTVIIAVVIGAALYLALRVFLSFRWTVSRKARGRKLEETEALSHLADLRGLILGLEAGEATARTLADQTAQTPDDAYEPQRLEFDLPTRFQGDTLKLEKLAAPYGPLAALAARKAQGLRFRLLDPNWEAAQRRDGQTTPQLYSRMAKDFTLAASQARRAERMLKEQTDSPTRRARLRGRG